jgi:hypothetical protein
MIVAALWYDAGSFWSGDRISLTAGFDWLRFASSITENVVTARSRAPHAQPGGLGAAGSPLVSVAEPGEANPR